jgi:Sec-independent protein secretion pathway component TatC
MYFLTQRFNFETAAGEPIRRLDLALIKMFVVQAAVTLAVYVFWPELLRLIEAPLRSSEYHRFLFPPRLALPGRAGLEMSCLAGLVLALPYHFYASAQFLTFPRAPVELNYLRWGFGTVWLLTLLAVGVACLRICPAICEDFIRTALREDPHSANNFLYGCGPFPDYGLESASLSLAGGLLLEGLATIFVLGTLNRTALAALPKVRPYAWATVFVLGASLAPTPDPATFFTLSLPIIVSAELCYWSLILYYRWKSSNDRVGTPLN